MYLDKCTKYAAGSLIIRYTKCTKKGGDIMIIIESDMKLGKQRTVTLDEAYRSLIATNHLSKKELNFKLLNNETVGNDRLYYYRMIPYLNPAMDKVIKKYKKQLEADIRNFYGIKKRG